MRAWLDRLRQGLGGTIDSTLPGSLRAYQGLVVQVGLDESRVRSLTDQELTAAALALRACPEFTDRDRVELCALGREAARRALGMRPFDVQLLGELGMLSGHVVQMATGEGKTLVGALAATGYALQGRQVHMVSVNDYLARRDAEWMGPCYRMLGISVGWIGEDSTGGRG